MVNEQPIAPPKAPPIAPPNLVETPKTSESVQPHGRSRPGTRPTPNRPGATPDHRVDPLPRLLTPPRTPAEDRIDPFPGRLSPPPPQQQPLRRRRPATNPREPPRPGARPQPNETPKARPKPPPELVELLTKSAKVQEYFRAFRDSTCAEAIADIVSADSIETTTRDGPPSADSFCLAESFEMDINDAQTSTSSNANIGCRVARNISETIFSLVRDKFDDDPQEASCPFWKDYLADPSRFSLDWAVHRGEPPAEYSPCGPSNPHEAPNGCETNASSELHDGVDLDAESWIRDDESATAPSIDPDADESYDLRHPQSRSMEIPPQAVPPVVSDETLIHEDAFWIRGIQYYSGRASHSEEVVLFEYPGSIHDPNAILVYTMDGLLIGYVDRKNALRLAPLVQQRSSLSLSFRAFTVQLPSQFQQAAVFRVYRPTNHCDKHLEIVPIAKASYASHSLREISNGVGLSIMTDFAIPDYHGGLIPCQDTFRRLVDREGATDLQKKYIPIAAEIMFGGNTRGKMFSRNLSETERVQEGVAFADGYEVHHVVPRCCGGAETNPSNLLFVTARDHYLLHAMMAVIFANKSLVMALNSFKMRFDDHVLEDFLDPHPDLKEEIVTIGSDFKHNSDPDFLDMYIQCRRYLQDNNGKLPSQDGSALSHWVKNIRHRYKRTKRQHFTEKELRLLDEIGMFRDVKERKEEERRLREERERRLREERRLESERKKEERRLERERKKEERRLESERKKEERRLEMERKKEERRLEKERKNEERRLKRLREERLKEERRLERERKKEEQKRKKEERRLKEKEELEKKRKAQDELIYASNELWKIARREQERHKMIRRESLEDDCESIE